MSNLTVQWIKCENNQWCDFQKLDLGHDHFKDLKGVYIIWNDVEGAIRVGSGIIKDRIADHRDDNEITAYGSLKVTWAAVAENQMQGVEKYLANKLLPEVGDRFPNKNPIQVNLPYS